MIFRGLDHGRAGFQGKTAAARHRVARVDHEVENDLRQLAGIDFGVHALLAALEMALHGNVFAEQAQERAFEIREEGINVHHARARADACG